MNQIVHVLFALNREYSINDKTVLAEVAEFDHAPQGFVVRVQNTLARMGASSAELIAAVENIAQLHREVVGLADGLYQPRFTLPK